jgi:hypothetical protein
MLSMIGTRLVERKRVLTYPFHPPGARFPPPLPHGQQSNIRLRTAFTLARQPFEQLSIYYGVSTGIALKYTSYITSNGKNHIPLLHTYLPEL